MTVAPLTRVPGDPCPVPDPLPAPRRPRLRAPGHEPEPLAAGAPHPRRHRWPGMRSDTAAPGPSTSTGRPARRAAPAPAPAPDPGSPAAVAPHARAGALVRSVLEVLAGRRRPGQLAAAVTPEVLRYLAAARPSTVRAVAPGRVHVRQPHPDAAEVVAVCRVGDRIRALTLRLDVRTGTGPGSRESAWMCTAVRLL